MGGDEAGGLETQAPIDWQAYVTWRRTDEGRQFWRERVYDHHVLYRCEQCGDEVWITKGDALPDTLHCPYPCHGYKARQREPQFWEADDPS